MSELFLIPPKLFPDFVDRVFPLIDAATAYSMGKYTGADVVREIVQGRMQLWAAVNEEKINGIAITEIVNYPCTRLLRFLCCTGEKAEEWFSLIQEIEAWGKMQGCKSFEAICRAGWERYLKNYDYKKQHVIMGKELA